MTSSSIHKAEVFDQAGRSEKPVVMVCLRNPADSELILQYLSDRYELIVGDSEIEEYDFDVCIIDQHTFATKRQKIIDYRDSKAPITVPFILLVKGENWSQTIDPVWNVVDDVVPIPTPTPILISRIEAMLKIRKHSLQLQKKNEQLSMYEQAMNAANVGISITDAREEDNPIIFVNEGFEELTGYSEEEILGRNCRFLQDDDRDQDALNDIRSFISEGKEGHAPLRNYRKDGTPFWNELSVAPIKDSEGKVTHFVGIQNDVTELMESQQKLKKERNLFQKLAESSPVGISIIDSEGQVTYANNQAEKILGLDKSEIAGLTYNDPVWRITDTDGKTFPKEKLPFYQVMEKGEAVYDVEHAIEWPDGKRRILSINAAPLKNSKGELEGVIASLSDITEKKEKERKLQEEKEFVQAVVNNMPGIFYMLDEDLNFVFWNKNMVRDLGYSDEEIPKMNAFDFIRPAEMEFITGKIGEVLESGNAEIEIDLIDKEGNTKRHFLIGTRFERNGETFILGSAVDISERVEAEFASEQQKKLLSAVINQTESIIYVKDSNGRYILVNDRHLEITGLDREEVIGKTDKEIFDNDFAELVMANDQKVLETGKTIEFEEELQVGGEKRKFLSIKNVLKGVPGFENCICGISTDITEREEAYSQLKERNKEKTCLYSIGNLNEIYSDIDKILEEAVSIIPQGLQYPEVAEAAIEYDGNIYTTPGFEHTKWSLVTESQNFKSKSIAVKVVYREEKCTSSDCSFLKEERELIDAIADTLASEIERIESREKLEESERRWEQLVQKNPGLVQIIDGDEIVFINPAGASLYGVDDVEELIGKSWTQYVHFEEEEIETVRDRINQARKGKINPPQIYRAWTADDSERYVELQSVPVQYKGKTVLMTVGQDVTDRVRFEEKLKQSLREKEILLQEIHHRVKNNLAVISGLLQIQRFSSEDEKVNKVLSNSEMRIKSMALIHEKLYQADSLSEIDFKYYIGDLVNAIEHTIKTSEDISIRLHCDSVTLNVNQAVPSALILNELISNSVEHAFKDREKGEVRVCLTGSDGMVKVRVEDNGKGLPEDFEKGERHSMGMTIIQTLISQLNAELKYGNDNGTFFEFTFKKKNIKGSSSTLV